MTLGDHHEFNHRNRTMTAQMAADPALASLGHEWMRGASRYEYSYHFTWMGLPIIQFPQDVMAIQEIIWRTQPDLIVETGIARGGSLVFHASMLELLGGDRLAVGIEIDLRDGNRAAIEAHPMARRIRIIDGSSADPTVVARVHALAANRRRVMVILDSLHTHDHVRAELDAYAPLVGRDSYLVVLDTIIEQMPDDFSADRPWGPGNNPATATDAFLAENDRFERDDSIADRLQLSVARGGYLRCLRNSTG